MLDDLVQTIKELRERIHGEHRNDLAANETRTRMALIDPLLTALGWDTSDPALVTAEFQVENRKADYALKNAGPHPAALIEAKKLGEGLGQHREQIATYANMEGVKYAGLTDGDTWEVYRATGEGSLHERRVLNISISKTPAYRCALEFLLLWHPNLESGYPVPANGPGLFDPDDVGPGPTGGERSSDSGRESRRIQLRYKGVEHYASLQPNWGIRLENPSPEHRLPDGLAYLATGAASILGVVNVHPYTAWRFYDEAAKQWRPIDDLPNAKSMKKWASDNSRYDKDRKRWLIHDDAPMP